MPRTTYIEGGNAKVAPCECSTRAIHEKTGWDAPTWTCRNCGHVSKRRVRVAGAVAGTGGLLKLDADGNLVAS